MKSEVKGNLTGIKNSVLEKLEGIFTYKMDKLMLVSYELVQELAQLTALIGREIAVYIDRRGQILEVSVGESGSVNLPFLKGRKDQNRLSGVRCIHTHPEAGPELSNLDLTSLVNMRFDCIAAVEVKSGRPIMINAAYLQPDNGILGKAVAVLELDARDLEKHNFLAEVLRIDKDAESVIAVDNDIEEKALLVGLEHDSGDWSTDDSLDELAELAATAGAKVLGKVSQNRPRPHPASYVGQGKARELGMLVQETGANCLIFDDELSPSQVRNLEQLTNCRILDRTTVILDIFASRAQTREGKVQVELAQLKHMLPRLTGMGTILSRLGGGIGTRGPGETKLETDRRHIRRRISELEKDLSNIKTHRALQRLGRKNISLPIVALVGYTNAGKSTLLNTLTDSDVLAEDKLFATLDPVTRRLNVRGKRDILLTDTVGFIRKLPHHLIAAFRATLEEVVQADLLIHIVDAGHPGMREHIRAVDYVLRELGAAQPMIMVLNKCDLLKETDGIESLGSEFPNLIAISALRGTGLEELVAMIDTMLPVWQEVQILIPYQRGDLLAVLHDDGEVISQEYKPEGTLISARLGPRLQSIFENYFI